MRIAVLSVLSLLSTSASAFAPSFEVSRMDASTVLFARRPFISGNWKLNPQTREEAISLAADIAAAIGPDSPEADVALFVPYVFIEAAMQSSQGKLQVGAEVRRESLRRYLIGARRAHAVPNSRRIQLTFVARFFVYCISQNLTVSL